MSLLLDWKRLELFTEVCSEKSTWALWNLLTILILFSDSAGDNKLVFIIMKCLTLRHFTSFLCGLFSFHWRLSLPLWKIGFLFRTGSLFAQVSSKTFWLQKHHKPTLAHTCSSIKLHSPFKTKNAVLADEKAIRSSAVSSPHRQAGQKYKQLLRKNLFVHKRNKQRITEKQQQQSFRIYISLFYHYFSSWPKLNFFHDFRLSTTSTLLLRVCVCCVFCNRIAIEWKHWETVENLFFYCVSPTNSRQIFYIMFLCAIYVCVPTRVIAHIITFFLCLSSGQYSIRCSY